MAHERHDIRHAVMTMLSGETAALTRVSQSRVIPVRMPELPAIGVYTNTESVDSDESNTAPRVLTRKLSLMVEAWVYAATMELMDDALDAIALEIETAMDADETLDGKAADSQLASTEFMISAEGLRPLGCVRLEYDVTYRSNMRIEERDGALEPFETATVATGLTPDAADDDKTHDTITLDQ